MKTNETYIDDIQTLRDAGWSLEQIHTEACTTRRMIEMVRQGTRHPGPAVQKLLRMAAEQVRTTGVL